MSTIQPYISDTDRRIASRNARADAYLKNRGSAYRFVARTGLGLANGFDRITALFTNGKTGALAGILSGAGGGLMTGIAIAVTAIVVIGITGPAATLTAGWIIGGMTLAGAAYRGHAHYKATMHNGSKRAGAERAERIAEMSGALPMETPQVRTAEEALENARPDTELLKQADAYVNRGNPPSEEAKPKFTELVQQSRTGALAR